MLKLILSYFFFIPKFFPHITFKQNIRPYFGVPKRNYGGPSLRTSKMIKVYGNYFFSPNIIYAQSWWTERELVDSINYAKKNNVSIIFNQNGWFYPAWYQGKWKKRNKLIVDVHKLSKMVIYQSNFCKNASKELNNYYKNSSLVIHNPSLIEKKNKIIKNKIFNILLTGIFGKDSKHILMPALKAINHIEENKLASFEFKLNIYGVIKNDMKNSNWFKDYLDLFSKLKSKKKVYFHGKYSHKTIHEILNNTNLAIHIKYKDPCPNAVIEKLQYGIQHIYSNSGGTPELIGDAGYPINVKNVWNEMVAVNYKVLAKKIILAKKNEKVMKKKAFKQSKKFRNNKYINIHDKIFNNLDI
tara:strand:+ start:713 stop:1780 length:1068 start_codon:yes stop_codon:yes gene_type:complete